MERTAKSIKLGRDGRMEVPNLPDSHPGSETIEIKYRGIENLYGIINYVFMKWEDISGFW